VRAPDRLLEGYVFDLDGTVYLGEALLPGAGEALAALKQYAGVVYLTNKPLQMPADYAAKLTRLGVETRPEEVVSSTDALLLYLKRHAPDARLFVVGEPPLLGLLDRAGYESVQEAESPSTGPSTTASSRSPSTLCEEVPESSPQTPTPTARPPTAAYPTAQRCSPPSRPPRELAPRR
jgi:ribonucleotide monophosphatase NagD (HAD superfamily)